MKIKSIIMASALFAVFTASQLFASAGIISLDDAIAKAEQIKQGKVVNAELERYFFNTVYEVKILDAEGVIHHVKVKVDTGEAEIASTAKIKVQKAQALNTAKISFTQAKEAALAGFPNGKIKDFELDLKSGKAVYEFEILDEAGIAHDVIIDAVNGGVLLSRQESFFISKPLISVADAEKAALVAVAGTAVYTELEEDDKALHYEVKVVSENKKIYEVKIDAATGKVLRTKAD